MSKTGRGTRSVGNIGSTRTIAVGWYKFPIKSLRLIEKSPIAMHHPRFLNYPTARSLSSTRVCTRNDALTGRERQRDHELTIADPNEIQASLGPPRQTAHVPRRSGTSFFPSRSLMGFRS